MKLLTSLVLFINVILIILLPAYGGGTGHAYYTYFTYILIPLSYYWYKKLSYIEYDILIYLKPTLYFVILTIIGGIAAFIFGNNNIVLYRKVFLSTCILIIYAFIYVVLSNFKQFRLVIKFSILISIFILVFYSFFSYFTQTNLYALLFDIEESKSAYNSYSESRGIEFRISGNTMNPVFFSGELMLLEAYCIYEFTRSNSVKLFWIILSILLLISNLFTGTKSGLIPALFIICYGIFYVWGLRRTIILSLFVLSFSSVIIAVFSDYLNVNLETLFSSLDISKTDTGGSNLSMRLKQLSGLDDCVGANILFGNGIGWTELYLENHDDGHPILLGFESLLFSAYCNGGVFAILIIYPIYLSKLYKINIPFREIPLYKITLLSYYFFILVTGNGSIKYLYIIIGLILGEYMNKKYNKL